MMTASQMGKKGIKVVNSLLTTEQKSAAAKKGWRRRKARLNAKKISK